MFRRTWFDNARPRRQMFVGLFSADEASAISGARPPTVLDDDMKRVVLEQRLGFVASVCPDGTPNLSPKGTTTVWDDTHLVFADIHSPRTVANLRRNPSIEINVVDPIVRKGYRFKGSAELFSGGDVYEQGLRLLTDRGYSADRGRIRTVVLVKVEHAAALVSPAYDEGASEREVAAKWEAHVAELIERHHRGATGS